MKTVSLLLAFVAAAHGNLGGHHTHQNEPGLNRNIADYTSCATELAELGEIAIIVGKAYRAPRNPPPPAALASELEGKRLVLGWLPGITLGGMPVVDIVPQQLVLRWIDGFHKSTQSEARFGGLYVLYPIAPNTPERVSFFRRWDVPVVDIPPDLAVPAGRYGLVPVSQIPSLEAALRDSP